MNSQLPPKIGLLSGSGPLAGADILSRILKQAAHDYQAVEDSEYPDLVLLSQGAPGFDNAGSLNPAFSETITTMIGQLESQNANILGIACNTAHLLWPALHPQPETTLINLIDTVAAAASQTNQSYLLLSSLTSKQQRLYHGYLDKHAVSFMETTTHQQQQLDDCIGLIMAHELTQAGHLIEKVLYSAKLAGFKAVIAGCTELPVAIAHCPDTHGLAIVNSNDELARALLKEYYARLLPVTPVPAHEPARISA